MCLCFRYKCRGGEEERIRAMGGAEYGQCDNRDRSDGTSSMATMGRERQRWWRWDEMVGSNGTIKWRRWDERDEGDESYAVTIETGAIGRE